MDNGAEKYLAPGSFEEKFVRSGGHGGQNINKVATAVQLRFSPFLSGLEPQVIERLKKLAGSRLTAEGDILILSGEYRTQEQNRIAARHRLLELIAKALRAPVKRRPTKPTYSSKKRRLESKKIRSGVKRLRQNKNFD